MELSKKGEIYTECGAMCFIPLSAEEHQRIESISPESFFIPMNNITTTTVAYVYYKYAYPQLSVLVHFGDNLSSHVKDLISSRQLQLVGKVLLSERYSVLRICDAREAHFVPKSPTPIQIEFAARRAHCPQEVIDSGHFSVVHLSEPLYSIPPSYYLEFWTGLDPQPLITACEAGGLKGWTQLPNQPNHWVLPAVAASELAEEQRNAFMEIKTSLSFRCGFDTKAAHFIYDICQEKINASPQEAAEYPTNTGTAVGVAASNDSYEIFQIDSSQNTEGIAAYLIQTREPEP
jgi:hypothetical protein